MMRFSIDHGACSLARYNMLPVFIIMFKEAALYASSLVTYLSFVGTPKAEY
jgi:hypothetical protein